MKSIVSAWALLAMFSARGEGRLNLSVSIEGLPDHEKVYLYGSNSKTLDSTMVANHSFAFQKDLAKGDLFIIQIGNSGDPQRSTMVYLEPGAVTAKGKGPYFEALQYSGAAYLEDAREIERMMSDSIVFKGESTLMQDMMEAQKIGDKERLTELVLLRNEYDSVKRVIAGQWVRNHLNSPMSASVISFFMANKLPADSLSWYVSKLGPQAKNNYLAEKLATMVKVAAATAIGAKARDFTLPDVQGHNFSLSGFKGKYVLVDFWASWCKPCRAMTPKLKAMYEKFKDKNFTIMGVSLDTDKEKWMKAIEDDGMTWTQVSDLSRENKAAQLYNITAIPATFLIDPKGNIIGYAQSEESLEKILKNAQ